MSGPGVRRGDRVCVRHERPLPDDGQPRRRRITASHGCRITTRPRARAGTDRRSTRPTRPAATSSRARRSACATAWPSACIATRPTRGRAEDRSAPRRPIAPSAASGATGRAATTSRRSQPASPTWRSSTPRPPRPRWSRRSSATTATSSAGIRAGRPRRPRLGPLAGGRLDPQPLQHRERRGVRLRHLPRSPQASRATTTAQYEAKCLSCHSPPGRDPRSCPVNPSKDCLGCRMPRVRVDSLHLSLTDHAIRVRRNSAATGDTDRPKSER